MSLSPIQIYRSLEYHIDAPLDVCGPKVNTPTGVASLPLAQRTGPGTEMNSITCIFLMYLRINPTFTAPLQTAFICLMARRKRKMHLGTRGNMCLLCAFAQVSRYSYNR